MKLSIPQRNRLWVFAQHRYGWGYVSPWERRTAESLVRKGLVHRVTSRTDAYALTDGGLLEAKRRWPVSPAVLGTYDHQPGGWTPREGVVS